VNLRKAVAADPTFAPAKSRQGTRHDGGVKFIAEAIALDRSLKPNA
jgi:hypothetical protein